MTNPLAATPSARRLHCARCGTDFSCDLSGHCWCKDEAVVLPLPADGEDCLCRDCLRLAAEAQRWPIGAALLDMDGTLIDSERVYLASLTSALAAFGCADGPALGHAMIGLPGPDCEVLLRDRLGPDFPYADFERAYIAHRDALLQDGLPLKPGAIALLDALRVAGVPMALVTSSSRKTAASYLELAGIHSYFDMVLTRDDVAKGKPSPDLYLLAASRLGVAPHACIAVEDSAIGIAAAHAAGTIAIMVPDILQPDDATRSLCKTVLPDLTAVLALLRTNDALSRPVSREAVRSGQA